MVIVAGKLKRPEKNCHRSANASLDSASTARTTWTHNWNPLENNRCLVTQKSPYKILHDIDKNLWPGHVWAVVSNPLLVQKFQ